MGGRGASSGISVSGKAYGTEYTTLYQLGNIKFIRYNESKATKVPYETMIRGRVYVTVNAKGEPAVIAYYDKENKRTKQIDLTHFHAKMKPHTHHGYEHSENDSVKGYSRLTKEESKMVDRVYRIWQNKNNKQ